MDQHFEFRANALNQSATILGKQRLGRIPLATPLGFRRHCSSEKSAAAGNRVHRPDPTPKARRATRNSAKVQAQISQLKFWLKVFSRFCQEESEQDHA